MISINQLTVSRGGKQVIQQLSQEIPAGSIAVILGPNGSGKSTLLAAIAGDIVADAGTVTIGGTNPHRVKPAQRAHLRSMAVQNQDFALGFTVRQIIEMGGVAEPVIELLDLVDFENQLVTTLSGGQKQRVAIAQAIAQTYSKKSQVLLLDEPFAAQDTQSRSRVIEVVQKLAQQGITVVLVAHSSESELSWADVVIQQTL